MLVLLCASLLHGRVEALENVSLITDFGYNGRHAYFFVALDNGHYKEGELDVKILRGQGSVDAIRQVRVMQIRICQHGLAGARSRQ